MEEKMKYTGIVEQIKELDTEIKEWNYHYQTLRAQLEHADQSIMTLHKKKWRLELLLIPVKTIPTFRPRKKKTTPEIEIIDLDKLSQSAN